MNEAIFIQELEAAMPFVNIALVAFMGYIFLYKSALVHVWFLPLNPIFHRLGFRLICMDRSFGIFAIRWKRKWMHMGEREE